MSNKNKNKDDKLSLQKGINTETIYKQSHFAHAVQIINKWPEWKKNIRCRPSLINNNQSIQNPDNS